MTDHKNAKPLKSLAFFGIVAVALGFAVIQELRIANATRRGGADLVASARVLYYVDPMHPAFKSDRPGIAPDCGMALMPVYANATDSSLVSAIHGITISTAQQQLIGLRTATVEEGSRRGTLRALGTVTADETRTYSITSGVEGWVKATTDDSIGSYVHRNQPLASYYSPEFIALEQGYLVATERTAGAVNQQGAPTTQATAARLRDRGMGEKQVNEIASTRRLPEYVDLTSPEDGVIISRNLGPGQRFEKGVELYRLADLGHVWINVEVPEGDSNLLRPGAMASVRLPGRSRTLPVRVSNEPSSFDTVTGTTRVRFEAENPARALLPNMIVDVDIAETSTPGMSIPLDALVELGEEQRVYVSLGSDSFEARSVTIGRRSGDRAEVLAGLKRGEKVVSAGTFLIDAEYRLKAARIPNQTFGVVASF